MREMHKWKDKVELSLDNRQIFFLFFGLSVVGCFVFALGVMVGRRVDFDTVAEADAPPRGLALLDADAAEPTSYVAGLRGDGPDALLPTEVADAPSTPAATDDAAGDTPALPAAKPRKPAATKPDAAKTPVAGATMASTTAVAADGSRKFTLQMKAFAKAEEAEAFAAPIRANGHEVRVEAHEIKGRVWHRVRMGEFDNWEDGLAAKGEFEKAEKTIAYVVRL